MPETFIPIVTTTPQYYSASKGTYVPIHEMEQHHLDNAIKKLQREQENGSPVPVNVLNGLLAEQSRRAAAKAAEQPVEQPQQPAKPAVEITVTQTPEAINFGVLAASLATVTHRLTSGVLQANLDPEKIKQLADAINAAVVSTGGVNAEDHPGTDRDYTGATLLEAVDGKKYPHLTARLLLNSLRSYGVTTIQQLAGLAYCDFGAIRFSTAEAFAEALELVAQVGLTWAGSSRILVNDGYINRILNPNASPIGVFVGEATLRLNKAVAGLRSPSTTLTSVQAIERIFNGIKRRLSLAASVLGTSLLARGRTAATAGPVLDNMTNLTPPFRYQVKQYLSRVAARVARIEGATEQPNMPVEAC
ncbi:hypothetical protein EKK58_01145 [Candidatus Dependentiae bacterium]|nr:MAG: hypothetical protein EKK58_01145 [Candidatus Dependentiae bacterium]